MISHDAEKRVGELPQLPARAVKVSHESGLVPLDVHNLKKPLWQ